MAKVFTTVCVGCGELFTFSDDGNNLPELCPECRNGDDKE
jgi:predicted Zn-ribbon and HTH transcriptional regulator